MYNDLAQVRAAVDGAIAGSATGEDLVAALEILDVLIGGLETDEVVAEDESNDESA